MDNRLFAIMDSDGTYLDRGLDFHEAAETLLTLEDHNFDFIERPDGLLDLVWSPPDMMRPTGIRAALRSDLLLQAASRQEPWNGRRVTMAEAWGPIWWSIAQPGRPPFYGTGTAQEAYTYCHDLNHRRNHLGEARFQVHEVTDDEELQRASSNGLAAVKLADALCDYRTVFPIDDHLPVVLRDLHYPDRLFELTSKIFVLLDIKTKNGLVSGGAHLRIRIDEKYTGWDEADWRAAIESALRRTEDTHLGWHFDLANPATTVSVSLSTMSGQDILLWRKTDGIVEDNLGTDLDRLRKEICHKIASVPESGRTNCLRQAALSADDTVEIKCKRRGLHLLSRRHAFRH